MTTMTTPVTTIAAAQNIAAATIPHPHTTDDTTTDGDAVATIVQQEKSVPVHQQEPIIRPSVNKRTKDKPLNLGLKPLRGTMSKVPSLQQNASEKETNEKINAYLKKREDDEVRSMT